MTICNGSGEDPNCSDQFTILNPVDHAFYMGYDIAAIMLSCGGIFADSWLKNY